jgi:ubiquinone/menaquinone biosynthesis C-methylase UbiE
MKDDYLASGFARVDDSGNVGAFTQCLSLLDSLPYFRWYKAETYHHLRLAPGLSVLDVGCGLGDDASRMSQLIAPGGRVVGVDSSVAMITEARQRFGDGENLAFEVGDAQQLPFDAGSFDRVRIDRTLQHIIEPEAAVRELYRVLKPEGLAVAYDNDWGSFSISSENVSITRQIQDEWCYSITNPWIGRHLNLFFGRAGFSDIAVHASVSQIIDFLTADKVYPLKKTVERLLESKRLARKDADKWLAEMDCQTKSAAFRAALTAYLVVGRKHQ